MPFIDQVNFAFFCTLQNLLKAVTELLRWIFTIFPSGNKIRNGKSMYSISRSSYGFAVGALLRCYTRKNPGERPIRSFGH